MTVPLISEFQLGEPASYSLPTLLLALNRKRWLRRARDDLAEESFDHSGESGLFDQKWIGIRNTKSTLKRPN